MGIYLKLAADELSIAHADEQVPADADGVAEVSDAAYAALAAGVPYARLRQSDMDKLRAAREPAASAELGALSLGEADAGATTSRGGRSAKPAAAGDPGEKGNAATGSGSASKDDQPPAE